MKPAVYETRPEQVTAMRFTVPACPVIHEWLGWDHDQPHSCTRLAGATTGDWFVLRSTGALIVMPPDLFRRDYRVRETGEL